MQTKHKIQAFTLSEMIVVIILTSIVVGMAFSVLSLVQKHMHGIQDNFNKNTELNKLEQSLWLDFNRYSNIQYSNRDEVLNFFTEMDSIVYQFTEDYIIKDIDTFNIHLKQKSFYFDGNTIQNGPVDAIKLEVLKDMQNQSLFIFKQNDATIYMK